MVEVVIVWVPLPAGQGHLLCSLFTCRTSPSLFFLHPSSLLPSAPPAQLFQGDGSAGDSIYGGKFKDEPAALKLRCAACLASCCMAPACLPLMFAWPAIALVLPAPLASCLSASAIAPEGVACRHDAAGVVGMANSGKRE